MERGKHLQHNLKKLETVSDAQWVKALEKCRKHVLLRLRKQALFGAHAAERLGMDPVDYYVSFAYDAIIEGNWEWNDKRTLGQQMARIAENRIGKEVEQYQKEPNGQFSMDGDKMDEIFYSSDLPPDQPTTIQEVVYAKKINIIEEAIQGNNDLEWFWDCVKEGMKPNEIAVFMEKDIRKIYKLRETLIDKVKASDHFQLG